MNLSTQDVARIKERAGQDGRRPKLTPEQLEDVLRSYASNETQASIARRYGVSKTAIRRAVRKFVASAV